jgi:phospholipid transport system transporter-binding protein
VNGATSSTGDSGARIVRDGETLRFDGALVRAAVTAVWPASTTSIDDVRRFDLRAVERVDSAGLALLSLLAERCGEVTIEGSPEGLSELRAAYRLGEDLRFARM